MGNLYGNSGVQKTKAPIPSDEVKESKKEFSQLKQQLGWKPEEQYILMNRQIMYTGTKDEIIANYDNFIQRNILGGQNPNISIPLGIYNHYSDYFNNTVLESFHQLTHTNSYTDDFPLQKKCQDGINEWLLIAYMNCRSCTQKQLFSVRFMFQVAVYTRIDKDAQQELEKIAHEQDVQNQQQHAIANGNNDNNDDKKQKEVYKVQIPQPLSDDELIQFQGSLTEYIAEYGWKKEEMFILMERQVLHAGTHDDIVPKYVDFFEKVVLGDKKSDHSMPIGVYDHYLSVLTNSIENSLSQVSDEDINEYKDIFKLQHKVDDGEREWLLLAVLSCNIATKPNKSKFYVRYAIQVAIYSRYDIRMKQLQKDLKIKQAQEQILNQVQAIKSESEENKAHEGQVQVTQYYDVVDYAAMGLKKPNDEQKDDKLQSLPKEEENKPKEAAAEDHIDDKPQQAPIKKPKDDTEPGSGLCDDAWSMEEDYTIWSVDDVVMWINVLDEDFGEKYGDKFGDLGINGSSFGRLKSEHYLISNLAIDQGDAKEFAAVVVNRIQKRMQFLVESNKPWLCEGCSMQNDANQQKCTICDKERT